MAVPRNKNHLATLNRKIQPSAWIITAGGLVPYEYCDALGKTFDFISYLPFVSELRVILGQFSLADKIGRYRLFEHDFRIGQGRLYRSRLAV